MFTGIIECIGKVISSQRRGEVLAPTVEIPVDISDSRIGDSFSINGACLTAVGIGNKSISFEISRETLERTTLGLLRIGLPVNIERALRISDRLGGHFVTGHIDTIGDVIEVATSTETTRLRIRGGSGIAPYIVEKGSICIDGVSLTIGTCQEDVFFVHLIPHTLKNTTLQYLRAGSRVNLEADLIGKYVERFLSLRGLIQPKGNEIGKDLLQKFGFM